MIDYVIASAMLMTTPILLAAIGGLVNRVGGIVNIGLESMMLVGALVAVMVSASTGSWRAALLAALLAGAVTGLAMSVTVTRLGANEIIAGLGFNVAIAGLVRFFLKSTYGAAGTFSPPGVVMLPRLDIPAIADVPILGPLISGQNILTWFAWLLVPTTVFVLHQTRLGLRLRTTGASETTAYALGLRPRLIRDGSTVFAGALAGLAGAHLSIGVVGLFNEGITAGRGFIALAAFYFGRNKPWMTAFAALLFGFFDALQIRLQGRGIPSELVQTLPYLVVILVLVALGIAERRRLGLEGGW
jgi:simple sugar transport system permease protein